MKTLKTMCVLVLFALMITANAECARVTIGNFEYCAPDGWVYESESEPVSHYHYETGDSLTGAYFMAGVDPMEPGLGFNPSEHSPAAEAYIDSYELGISAGMGAEVVESYKIDDGIGVSKFPNRIIRMILPVQDIEMNVFACLWMDADYFYMISYSNPTKSIEKNMEDINALLAGILPIGSMPITINGTGVSICDPLMLTQMPARITFKQPEPEEYDVSCMLGEKTYSVLDGIMDTNGAYVLNQNGEYTFLVEAKNEWDISIEPLKDIEYAPVSGSGDWVSDIYTFDKPSIVAIDAKFVDRDNLILHAYVENKYGWDRNYLLNELKESGCKDDFKAILKIPAKSRVFFVLDFDDGEWSFEVN